jgi:integrase
VPFVGRIDWDHGCLVVRQALDLPAVDGAPRFKETKTHRAVRPVSLPTQVVDDLREHRAQQVHCRLAAPTWVDLDLVFTNDGGLPLVAVTLRKYLDRLLVQASLPRVRLHGLRHSMATLMLASGEHVLDGD